MIYPEKYKYMFQVKCETQVYHPNIDLDGNVCLNILREDWKPVLTINAIVYGIQYLFLVSQNPLIKNIKVGCVIAMVISSKFRMGQY